MCLGFSKLKAGGGRLTAKVLCLGFTEFEEGYCKIWHSKQKAYIIALQNCVISIVSVFNFNKSEPATDKVSLYNSWNQLWKTIISREDHDEVGVPCDG